MKLHRNVPIVFGLVLLVSTLASQTRATTPHARGAWVAATTDAAPAWRAASALSTVGGEWTELTTLPYDLEDPR